jgi:hypothetical protein
MCGHVYGSLDSGMGVGVDPKAICHAICVEWGFDVTKDRNEDNPGGRTVSIPGFG